LTNWSLAVNLDDLAASIPFPLAKWKTAEVETFLEQSRFSNSQHGKSHTSCIRSWSVLLTFQLSNQTRKYAQDRSKLVATLLSVAITSVRRSTPSFLVLLPLTVDYLDR
jgi:hypothetical protein